MVNIWRMPYINIHHIYELGDNFGELTTEILA